MDNKTIALGLRAQTISKQQALSGLNIPNTNYSKQQLMTGMQGRVQRRENRRFIQNREKQSKAYAKQKAALEIYIAKLDALESQQVAGDFAIQTLTPISPVPKTSFWGLPKLNSARY